MVIVALESVEALEVSAALEPPLLTSALVSPLEAPVVLLLLVLPASVVLLSAVPEAELEVIVVLALALAPLPNEVLPPLSTLHASDRHAVASNPCRSVDHRIAG